jgi:hypothetical protein
MHCTNICIYIEIQFDYKYKYIAQVIYNKKFPLSKQKFITNTMNHKNQILSFKILFFINLFLLKRN